MRNGDISNRELPRIWWVVEGLVLLPIKEMPSTWRTPSRDRMLRMLRDSYEMNTLVKKRIWDMLWRYDVRSNLVSFNDNEAYAQALQEWLDEIDYPAPLYSYTHERFMDEVVTLPSCWQVLDPDPSRSLTYGSKGTFFAPNDHFDPMSL
jgi:hypothetical protein